MAFPNKIIMQVKYKMGDILGPLMKQYLQFILV